MAKPESGRRFVGTEVLLFAAVCAATWGVLSLLAGFNWIGVPFAYSGDALWAGAGIKGLIQHGWYLVNPSLGAPGAMNLTDYPITDVGSFAILKVISWFVGDWAIVINLFFLVCFPLIALAALVTLRSLGVGRLPAATAALLYAFLPLHFERGQPHLFLSAYFVVPLASLTALWLTGSSPPAFGRAASRFWLDRRGAAALAVAFLLGVSGVYYAFFACFFLVIAAIVGTARRHDRRGLVPALVIVATIIGVSTLALSPSLLSLAGSGRNVNAVQRSPIEAELYGLKLDALLLPVPDHRLPGMRAIRETYLGMVGGVGPAWNNEASQAAGIGSVASAGFLILLAWLFVGSSQRASRLFGKRRELVAPLASLNIAGVLLATVGGVGAAVAVVLPQIRAYNRISVYLAFFALAAVALLLDAVCERIDGKMGSWAAGAVALALTGVGILDQVPEPDPAAAVRNARLFRSDQRFVQSIERRLGPGRAVFQLPYVPFPESPPVYGMTDYQHFRAYLHSSSTRFSYGAVKGRPTADWQAQVSNRPFQQMIVELKRAGFSGVWIDVRGYADGGAAILSQALEGLGATPIRSEAGEVIFFPID